MGLCFEPYGDLGPEEKELLVAVGNTLAAMIRRTRAEEELRRAHEVLEDRVAERTEQLQKAFSQLQAAHSDLKQTHAQMVHQARLASIGQLAAGVAHEINNPVGFIASNVSTLADYVGTFKELLEGYGRLAESCRDANGAMPPEVAELVARVEEIREQADLEFILEDVDGLLKETSEGTDRVKEIVSGLKTFSRVDHGEVQEVDVNEGIESTLKVIWNEVKYHCTVERDLRPLPPLLCYPSQLNQVFMNLIVNAAQAIEGKGVIRIESEQVGDDLLVRVSDTGSGILPENLPRLFDPFFTTKPVGQGTGLGLSISYGIVQKHGGQIEVNSTPGRGTTFTVRLPRTGTADRLAAESEIGRDSVFASG